jgi:hypothetical protein
MYVFRTLSEVREITDRWIREYNEERPHDALDDLTPNEYLAINEQPENSKIPWTKRGRFTSGNKKSGLEPDFICCTHYQLN